jgi:hypothetical protein
VTSLDSESVRLCACDHFEWEHVWNSRDLLDGRGPFSVVACNHDGCDCADYVDAGALLKMSRPPKVTG